MCKLPVFVCRRRKPRRGMLSPPVWAIRDVPPINWQKSISICLSRSIYLFMCKLPVFVCRRRKPRRVVLSPPVWAIRLYIEIDRQVDR